MNNPPWTLVLPSPLSCIISLTATFVLKGKSTICSVRPDYMKSKIWLIIACKLTGKNKWQCTECGFKENSRNHCTGLKGAEISNLLSHNRAMYHVKVWNQGVMLFKVFFPKTARRRASVALLLCCLSSLDILSIRKWLERSSHPPSVFSELEICLFGFVSSNHVPLNFMVLN